MQMSYNKPPELINFEITFDAGYGRCMAKRTFRPTIGDDYIYTIWWYTKGFPSIVFPLTVNREVIAVKEFRHGIVDFSLELPGGLPTHQEGETLEEVARRELQEETGYIAGNIIKLTCDPWVETQSINLRFYPFLALNCRLASKPVSEETVISETILIPLEEWYRKIFNGEIVCSTTITHSLLVLPHLLKEGLRFK